MRVLIVGPGAIGLALYYALSRHFDTWLGVLERHRDALKGGVELVLPSGRVAVLKPRAVVIEPEAPRLHLFDVVIVAVKMHSLETALQQVAPCIGIDTAVATVQNGWDPHGLAIKFFGYRAVHVLLTTASRRECGRKVVVSSWGSAFVGSRYGVTKFVQRVAEVLSTSGIGVRIVRDIDGWTWLKLAVNAAVNPLTALLRIENGEVLHPNLYSAAHRVVEEVSRVAERCLGIELPANPHEMLDSVVKETSRNRSSMLQDIEAGRKTEVDYINGAIHRIAEVCGVDDSANYVLLSVVKYLESRKG